jgi:nucleoside-diphosphate-sugar epimerase
MSNNETILVTGANGFIGGWLAESLYLSGEANVRAAIHSWSSAVRPARFPMTIVLCDIMDRQRVDKATTGVSCVIHCAKGPSAASIIQGTQNVLEAALRQGVRRFVYLSTAEVYGDQIGEIDEMTSVRKTENPYGDAKIEAEKLCWEYHARGLPVTVIRPSIVYGPFSKTWTVGIALKLKSGNWGIFKSHGDGLCNLIYITDLVSAIVAVTRDEHAVGQAFNLNGPEVLTWNQYFQRFNAALSLPELKVVEPGGASLRATIMEPVRSSAKFAKTHFERPIRKVAATFGPAKDLMKYVEATMKTTPRPSEFSLYNRKALYVDRKARDMLGWRPQLDLDSGLKLSVHWLRQLGFVSQSAQEKTL